MKWQQLVRIDKVDTDPIYLLDNHLLHQKVYFRYMWYIKKYL